MTWLTWPFGWDDLPYVAFTIVIGLTVASVVARFIWGPGWPRKLYADLLSLRRPWLAGAVLGLLFAILLVAIFEYTSSVGCSSGTEIITVNNQIAGRVTYSTPNCEVSWIWENQ